jgi:MraZ protein
MSQFLGTHQNRLDAKGRVSVPAPFRDLLKDEALVLRPSHKHACIEAWPLAEFEKLARPLENLDLFSEAHDDMAAALYIDAYQMKPDKDGRVLLPELLVAHASLKDQVVFMGFGRIFHIWEPAAGNAFRIASRQRASSGGTLPGTAKVAAE